MVGWLFVGLRGCQGSLWMVTFSKQTHIRSNYFPRTLCYLFEPEESLVNLETTHFHSSFTTGMRYNCTELVGAREIFYFCLDIFI